MKRAFSFVSIICVLLMIVACTPISFAYDSDTEIIYSKTFDEYSDETAESVIETEEQSNYDEDKAIENDYYTFRAVVCAPDIRAISFARFSPIKVVFDETGEFAVLVFENAKDTEYAVETLNKTPGIEYAQSDRIVEIPKNEVATDIQKEVENNSREIFSWGVSAMQCDQYASFLKKAGFDTGIVVAVIDSGYDMDHSYFSDVVFTNPKDYIDLDSKPNDENGHGTHVTGTILDCIRDLKVEIMPIRALNKSGTGSSINIANAVNYAVKNGAKVINMSLGGSTALFEHYPYEDTVINNAHKNGVVCCVAAGNEAEDCSNHCPAHVENAITVSAIDRNFDFDSLYSNYGEGIDICAPGEMVYSSYLDDTYAYLTGTSMATPHITAACAMIRLNYPDFTPNNVSTALSWCAKDLGDEGKDIFYGNGLPQLAKLIELHTHVEGEWKTTKKATCGADGEREVYCTICDKLIKKETIKATGNHSFSNWNVVTKPSCVNEGLHTRTCSVCKLTQTEKMDMLAHDFDKTVHNPTCTENGYTTYSCKNCTLKYDADIIGANGHSCDKTVYPRTCTQAGYTTYSCKNCTYTYDSDFVQPIGHVYEDIVVPKTCTTDGYTLHQCKNCTSNYTTDYVPASHEMTEEVIAPTCTLKGYTHHRCSKCDYYYNDTITDFAAHKLGDLVVIIPATVTMEGLEGQYCSECKALINSRAIPKSSYIFEKAENAKITIDEENKLILGVPQGLSDIDDLLHLENCTLEYEQTINGFGTGTVINVIVDKKVEASYTIIVYGDVTGDGYVDSFDSSKVSSASNYEIEFGENSPEFIASDLTFDGFIDIFDLSIVNAVANFEIEL